jgi:hypothetical protein
MESARGGGGGDGRHHLETLALVSKEGTDPPPYPLLVLFVDLSWAEDSYLFSDLITTVFFPHSHLLLPQVCYFFTAPSRANY